MKALFLAASAAALAATLPASASVFTAGSTFARSCYLAADARLVTQSTMADCNAALNVQPLSDQDRLASHVNRGILHMAGGNFAAATLDFEMATQINPNHPEPWLNLAILHYNRRNIGPALEMFERAIDLGTSEKALAYYGRGLANEEKGNLQAAYADLRMAQQLRPDWPLPGRELARFKVRR